MHVRNAALLALLAVLVLAAGVDVRVPWEMRAPVSIVLLLLALGLSLHDPIHSVWVTHRRDRVRVPIRARAPRRVARPHPVPHVDRTRGSRPGWL